MLAICNANEPVAFKAPKTSSKAEKKVTQGKQPRAKSRHRRKSTSSLTKHNTLSKIEATKGGSSVKETTGFKAGQSKQRTQSSSVKDSSPIQPSASTHVVAKLHKEDQQATRGLTSLGVTTFTILHSESASGHDASATSTAEADPEKIDPNDSISQQDKTKSASEGLETVHTKPATGKGPIYIEKEIAFAKDEFNTSLDLLTSDDTKTEIKLEDLSKLVPNLDVDFMDLDSPEDDQPIIVEDEEEEESVKIQELSTQLLLLQTLNSKLVKEKDAAKTEAALLKAKPSFPNLKELLSKFTNLIGELKELNKYVEKLEVELPGDLKEIPSKIEKFTSTVSSLTTQVAELKTLQWELPAEFLYLPDHVSSIQDKIKILDALPSLLQKVTEALNRFSQVLELASKKTEDHGVPSAGQARTHPTEGGEEHTTSHNLLGSPQPEGKLIKKDKGKKAMSSKDAKEEDTRSDFDEDANLTGSMVESSKKKKLKKFNFVTVRGYHIYLTTKQIKEQKRIEESVKADLDKQEVELGKDELVDLLAELEIDFNKPLSDQDLILKLNDLARKKRKHPDDIHDYFRSTKKFKSPVQYKTSSR
ncbi:hypothetical protein Tco_0546055 [Tanacetum coccineum]